MTSSDRESCALPGSQNNVGNSYTLKVQRLNDALRTHHAGGRICITRGVQELGLIRVSIIIQAVQNFDGFDAYNDPHGEHDFGALDIAGKPVLWKIDYYDEAIEFGSPDPSDPNVTVRVMTIMLSSEY